MKMCKRYIPIWIITNH